MHTQTKGSIARVSSPRRAPTMPKDFVPVFHPTRQRPAAPIEAWEAVGSLQNAKGRIAPNQPDKPCPQPLPRNS